MPPNPDELEYDRQLNFHGLLLAARHTTLGDGLADALASVDPQQLRTELGEFVPVDVQTILATAGIRDEHVFPVPVVLREKPSLVGYYRLLLGMPQKRFYVGKTGMGMFKSMENLGSLSKGQDAALDSFCSAMAEPLAELIRLMTPTITPRDISDLQLLVLGSQLYGSINNKIGQEATKNVFLAIEEIVKPFIDLREDKRLHITNSAIRKVRITLRADPDVAIEEEFNGEWRKKVAIEIKGGRDKSNAHNRVGEANKSHEKAKTEGFRDFWTIISIVGNDPAKFAAESKMTTSWFEVSEVVAQAGPHWEEFRTRIAGEVGVPVE